jgi:hypothetical protein
MALLCAHRRLLAQVGDLVPQLGVELLNGGVLTIASHHWSPLTNPSDG